MVREKVEDVVWVNGWVEDGGSDVVEEIVEPEIDAVAAAAAAAGLEEVERVETIDGGNLRDKEIGVGESVGLLEIAEDHRDAFRSIEGLKQDKESGKDTLIHDRVSLVEKLCDVHIIGHLRCMA